MTRSNWWLFTWLFNRRVGVALLWSALVIGAAVLVNLFGIRIVGGIDGWERWLRTHAIVFLTWRLCLYAGTVWGGGGCASACSSANPPRKRANVFCASRSPLWRPSCSWRAAHGCNAARARRQT